MDEFWYDWSLPRRNQKELVDATRERQCVQRL